MKNENCKHKPQYSLQINYGGKNKIYICKNCGKRIKANTAGELLFLFFGVLILVCISYLAVNWLKITPFLVLLLIMLMAWFPGSLVFFYLLPFHAIDDNAEEEREKR